MKKAKLNDGLKSKKIKYKSKFIELFRRNIQMKLISSFLVPVLLIIVLGLISYNNAAKTITNNYEKSTISTSEAMGMYLGLITSEVSSKVTEIINNPNLIAYYSKVDKLEMGEAMELYRDIKSTVVNMKASSDNIYSYHIIGEKGNSISSNGSFPKNIYEEFIDSPEGKEWIENKALKEKWSGNHKFIDEKARIDNDSYGLSLTKRFARSNGYIIVDIRKDVIIDVLSKMNLSDNSFVSFVAPDGREITLSNEVDSEHIFKDLDFFKESFNSKEQAGFSYVTYEKAKYLYVYAKIEGTDMFICSLIPEADILMQLSWIRNSTIIIVILASIIAIIIGTFIATGMSKEVKSMGSSFAKVSVGDFTTEFKTNRKDEFMLLNDSIKNMVASIRGVIGDIKAFGSQVFSSSESLSKIADTVLVSTKDISYAIEEIGQGIVFQAADTEKSLEQMQRFSDKINQVCKNTEEMGKVADNTIGFINNGMVIIEDLGVKSGATADVTKVIIREIEELENQSKSIGSIIGAMNEIAEQTNLLSLNASIEAARAGQSGRGFGVVAAEIGKLAEQSVNASNRIKKILDSIQVKTKETVVSARKAESLLVSQSEALNSTVMVFGDVNLSVDNLVVGLKEVTENMGDIGYSKEEVLESIRNISAVSEEAAASSQEIVATVNEQVNAVTFLAEEAGKLTAKTKTLEESMKQFLV